MLNGFLFNGTSDAMQTFGLVLFLTLGIIWGINLAIGFGVSFTLYGYPNSISERHIFLLLTALPWIIISPFTYFGIIYGFYGFYTVWMIFSDRFGPFKRFDAYCLTLGQAERDENGKEIEGTYKAAPFWFTVFA